MPEFRLQNARDGHPIPLVEGISLHSHYDPVNEGIKLAATVPDGPGVTVFGAGFGYHITPLFERFARVQVFEPIPALREAVCTHPTTQAWVHRVEWLDTPEAANPDFATLALPPMRRLFPDEFTRLGRPVIAPVPADTPLSGLKVLVDYPIYGGSHTTATYIENALRELGCQVEGIDNAYADPLLQRILAVRDSSRSGNMAGKLTELLSDLYLAKWEAFQPHVAIFTAQSPITVGALRTVRSTSATAFWFVEDYRRFGYWRDYAREFDVFAGIQKGRFFEELLRCGCPNPIYLPMAADPNLHKPTPLSPDEERFFGADVVFMGAGYPNRHALLTELADLNLKVWGTGWEGNPRLAPFIAKSGQRVTIEESVKIFNATRINLNLHSSMESGYFEADGDFLNPRTFEIMACGGFQLTDSRSLLPELFTNGREIVTFGSLQELRDKTAYYLAHPAERKQIAEAGRRRVLAEHTYTHRLRTLLSAVLSRRPDISKQAVEKTRQTENALSRIADPELERFLRDIPAEKRDSLHDLAEAAHNGSGTLKWHEAMILALETFAGED